MTCVVGAELLLECHELPPSTVGAALSASLVSSSFLIISTYFV